MKLFLIMISIVSIARPVKVIAIKPLSKMCPVPLYVDCGDENQQVVPVISCDKLSEFYNGEIEIKMPKGCEVKKWKTRN